MPHSIKLDNKADHDIYASGEQSIAYFLINDVMQVGVKFTADYSENGEPNEYWGNDLAVVGDTWIEVNDISELIITAIHDLDDNELPLNSYAISCDDEMKMRQHIEDLVCGIETVTIPANRYYSK